MGAAIPHLSGACRPDPHSTFRWRLPRGIRQSCEVGAGRSRATACTETQAPDNPRLDPSIASSLPVLKTAKLDLAEHRPPFASFDITLRFVVPPSARLRTLFRHSAERWEEIIITDVPAITGTFPRNTCGPFGTPGSVEP